MGTATAVEPTASDRARAPGPDQLHAGLTPIKLIGPSGCLTTGQAAAARREVATRICSKVIFSRRVNS